MSLMLTIYKWTLQAALNADLVLLRVAQFCVAVCEEWISLRQARVEQLLGAAWLAAETLGVLHWPAGLFRGLGLAIIPLNLLWALARHRRPSAERKALIALESQIALRVCLLGLNVFGWLLSTLTHTLDFVDLSGVLLVAFVFVTALPQDANRMGRKRKLALAKLKEMFGTSWMPAPEGGRA